jgi:hypothetical protein
MQTRLRRGEVPARDAARRVRVISELLRALPAATYTDSLAQLRREAAAAGDGGEAESGGEGPVNCDTAQASLADALDMYLLAHRAEAESRLHPSQRRRPASASHAGGGGGGGGGGGDGSLRGVSDASVDAALAEVMSTYLGRALLPLGAAPAHPHLAPSAVRYVGPRPSTAAAAVNGAYANAGRRPRAASASGAARRAVATAATSGVGMLAPPPQAARPPPVLGGAPRPHRKAPPPPPLEPAPQQSARAVEPTARPSTAAEQSFAAAQRALGAAAAPRVRLRATSAAGSRYKF